MPKDFAALEIWKLEERVYDMLVQHAHQFGSPGSSHERQLPADSAEQLLAARNMSC
jgi:hypothetical protein